MTGSRLRRLKTSRLVTIGVAIVLALSLIPFIPAQPALATSGPMNVSVYTCPDGFNAEAAVYPDFVANCVSPVLGSSFTLTPDAGPPGGFVTDAAGNGFLAEIPPGGGVLAQTAIGGFSSKVFCSIVPQGGGGGAATEFPAAGNAIAYNIGDGQEISCQWFNYQEGAVQVKGEVTIRKYNCPPAYDAGAADFLTVQSACSEPGGLIPFAVVPNGEPSMPGSTDGSGYALWPEVTAGPGAVKEGPGLYKQARVFCDFYDIGGPPAIASPVDYPAPGREIVYDLPLTKGISCWWFNWDPFDESFINVFKNACPEGYDWSAADYATVKADCVTPVENVSFNLTGPAFDDTKATDNIGLTGWNVDPGDYVLTEALPAGYSDIRVFCGTYPTAVGPGMINEVLPVDTSVAFTLDPETSIDCFWFNLPQAPGRVNVDTYECPAGYVNGTPFDDLNSNCTTKLAGVTFELTPSGSPAVQANTDGTGSASFANVNPGPATLDEKVPPGYSLVIAYCSISDSTGDSPYQQYAISAQNVLDFTVGSGETWNCKWFNIASGEVDLPTPETTASLTIDKYTCPDGFDYFDEDADLGRDCILPTEDILFTLENDESELGASTGEGGKPATIQFSNLEPGDYLLTEEIPSNVSMAFISECTSSTREFGDYPFGPFVVVEADGRIMVNLEAGESLRCSWFNVLQVPQGTVTITKYWCDDNTLNEDSCDLYPNGADFRLVSVEDDTEHVLTTGPDGTATVETSGVFDLVEVDFSWCFAESDAANAEGKIEIAPGESVAVDVYNCGPRPISN